jgi:hypothetical protein
MDSSGSGYSLMAGFFACGNENSDSVKYKKIVDQLSDYKVLKL